MQLLTRYCKYSIFKQTKKEQRRSDTMPGGFCLNPRERQPSMEHCVICNTPEDIVILNRCRWCNAYPICQRCFISVEHFQLASEADRRRCLQCALPICQKCGWEGDSVNGLQYYYPQEGVLFPRYVCPACNDDSVVAAYDRQRNYDRHYPVPERLKTEIEALLENFPEL